MKQWQRGCATHRASISDQRRPDSRCSARRSALEVPALHARRLRGARAADWTYEAADVDGRRPCRLRRGTGAELAGPVAHDAAEAGRACRCSTRSTTGRRSPGRRTRCCSTGADGPPGTASTPTSAASWCALLAAHARRARAHDARRRSHRHLGARRARRTRRGMPCSVSAPIAAEGSGPRWRSRAARARRSTRPAIRQLAGTTPPSSSSSTVPGGTHLDVSGPRRARGARRCSMSPTTRGRRRSPRSGRAPAAPVLSGLEMLLRPGAACRCGSSCRRPGRCAARRRRRCSPSCARASR